MLILYHIQMFYMIVNQYFIYLSQVYLISPVFNPIYWFPYTVCVSMHLCGLRQILNRYGIPIRAINLSSAA